MTDFENTQENQIEYPVIPIELLEGSIINIYTRVIFSIIG